MASLQAEACKSLVTRMWEPGAVDIASLQRTVDALRVQQESVQQEREQLEAMKAAVDGNIERFKQRVKLNVGGSRFETTLSTLTRHPDSMLAVMFSGRHEVPQDDDGYVFIDRDGAHFRTILNFLRDGVLDAPASQKAMIEWYGRVMYLIPRVNDEWYAR